MTKLLPAPYCNADFRAIRSRCAYVDKTRFIEAFERLPEQMVLFLWPSRFGKTIFA